MKRTRIARRGALCVARSIAEVLERRVLLSVPEPLDISSSGAEAPLAAVEAMGVEPLLAAAPDAVTKILYRVPEYLWYNGCAPTSTGMIMGYWDQVAYPGLFTGNASTQTAEVDNLIASPEHIRDYGPKPDPGTTHSNNCIADFIGTSRDPLKWGWTYRDNYPSGFEDYADWRGYDYADAFNRDWGSVSFDDIKNEINADRPFLISVDSDGDGESDHAMAVMGYRTSPSNQFAARTTWNGMPGINWFDWEGMEVGDPFGVRGVTFFRPSDGRPDLAPSFANVPVEPLTWGDSFTFSYTVENYGGQNAGASTIKFYLSNNDIISSTDTYLGSAALAALNAYDGRSGSVTLSLPAAPPAGFTEVDTIYVGMIVDANDDIAEGAENNNTAGTTEARDSGLGENIAYDRVEVSTKADLVGREFTLDMPVLNFGRTEATFEVANQGRTNAGSFQVKFYLSANTFVSTSDTLLGTRTINSLGAGATYSGTISLTVPTTPPVAGDNEYTIGMIIDEANSVAEDDEGNNRNEGYGLDKEDVAYGMKLFNATFDNGDGAMEIQNDTVWAPEDGLWHVSTRGSVLPFINQKMYYGVEKTGNYDIGDSAGVFLTKNIALPDGPVAMSFTYMADVDGGPLTDEMRVQVYDVVAGSYTTILSKVSGLTNDTGGKYVQVEADLSAFAGSVVRLRWLFDTHGTLDNKGEGWYVDNIAVWGLRNAVTVEWYRSLRYDSNYTHTPSTLNFAGDHDAFVFNEEQLDGTFAIATQSVAAVRPGLAVYDYKTGEMLRIDSGAAAGSEASISLTNSGWWNTYLVELWDVEEDSTGSVDAKINGTGVSAQTTMTVNASGHAERLNQFIHNDTDTAFYVVTAPADASGDLEILVDPHVNSGLLPRLQVWKNMVSDAPDRVVYNNEGPTAAVFTDVKPGDVFYISVSDNDFAVDRINLMDIGGFDLTADFSTALPAALTSAGAEGFAYFHYNGNVNDSLNFDANIGSGTDVDSYIFAGEVDWDGNYVVTATAPAGSNVHPVIAVYNGVTGERLAVANSGGTATAQLTVNLPQAVDIEYVVAVADDTSTKTGDVVLTIDAPGTGALFPIAINAAGDGSRDDGNIGNNDTDFYSFTAPADANGNLTVTVTPLAGIHTLDAAFALFDSTGKMLGQRYSAAAGVEEVLTFGGIVPGQAYSVSVMSRDHASAGLHSIAVDFDLIVPDEYPTGTDYDTWMLPNQNGDIVRNPAITAGDPWGTYLIDSDTPDASATFTAEATGGAVVPIIGLYDAATGQRLAWSTNPTNASTASFTASISKWTRYYVAASTKGGAAGNLRVTVDLDSPDVLLIALDAAGQGSVLSALQDQADIDYWDFTAPATANGKLTVTLTNPAAALRGAMALYDSAGRFLASDSAAGVGENASMVYSSVQPGQTYTAAVTSHVFNNGSGAYTVNVDFDLAVPLTINSADADYDWEPNQFGDEKLNGDLSMGQLSEIWAIRPEDAGPIKIDLSSATFPVALGLFDAAGNQLAAEITTLAGQTASINYAGAGTAIYYIFVSSRSGSDDGVYSISMDVPRFPTIGSIAIDPSGSGSITTSANPLADQDYFGIVAPGGAYSVTVKMTPAAALAANVRLYDTAGNELAVAQTVLVGKTVSFSEPVTAGETYIIGASGQNLTIGNYTIDVQFKITPGYITGTGGDDNIYVRRDPGNAALVQVYVNAPLAGPPTYSYTLATLPNLTINSLGGEDSLTVDFRHGDPVPVGGISFDGGADFDWMDVIGAGAGSGRYTPDKLISGKGLIEVGTSQMRFVNLEPVSVSDFAAFTLATPNGADNLVIDSPAVGRNRISGSSGGIGFESLTFYDIDTMNLELAADVGGANDTILIQPAGLVAAGLDVLKLNVGAGANRLTILGGSATIDTNLGIGGVNLDVLASGASHVFFPESQTLNLLSIADTSKVELASLGTRFLSLDRLSMAGAGVLDLFDNDMIVQATAATRAAVLGQITQWIGSARNALFPMLWLGAGITSTTARSPLLPYRSLGVALNDNGLGERLRETFAGQPVTINDVLVKHTWDGDANVDGVVNADDYFQIDSGFITQAGGWYNGDFNYDGVVNADDYFLIDSAFLGQGGPLAGGESADSAVVDDAVIVQPAKKREADSLLAELFSTEPVV